MHATSLLARGYWAACAFLLACGVAYAEPIVVERESSLQAEPRVDAPVIATLKRGTTGEATAKKGAWVNIKTSAGSGWIFSFNVRFTSLQSSASSSGDASALGRVVGPRQKLNVTSTIGIRGIGSEDLRQARFNEQQIQLLEKSRSTADQARASAASSGLKAVHVNYVE